MNASPHLLGKLGIVGWIAIFVIAMGMLLWLFRPTSWFGLMMFLAVALPVGFSICWMYHVQTRTAAWQHIRQHGIAGCARVLKSESISIRVSKQPQVRLQLAVSLPGEPPTR